MPPPQALTGHTPGHINCSICEAHLQKKASPEAFVKLPFSEAASIWFADHRVTISVQTRDDYAYYFRSLLPFFGDMPLTSIHVGHLQAYQEWRQAPHKDERGREWIAGPSAINHELSTLGQIMQRAGLWERLKRDYKPLHQPESQIGKVLSAEQKQRLFVVACSNPRWYVAYYASLLSVNTSAGPGEIRHLRFRELELTENNPRIMIAEGLKNENRYRSVPLIPTALQAVKALAKRARRIIAQEGLEFDRDHYLLPALRARGRSGYDPTRPQGSWKHAWESLREKADLPHLRLYDLRHQIATEMLEDPEISEQTIQEIVGHKISGRMLKHYSHIRDRRKREALSRVETKAPPKQLGFCFEETVSEDAWDEKLPNEGARIMEFRSRKSTG
jgi:integrase